MLIKSYPPLSGGGGGGWMHGPDPGSVVQPAGRELEVETESTCRNRAEPAGSWSKVRSQGAFQEVPGIMGWALFFAFVGQEKCGACVALAAICWPPDGRHHAKGFPFPTSSPSLHYLISLSRRRVVLLVSQMRCPKLWGRRSLSKVTE